MAAPQTSSRVNAVTFDSSTNGDRGDQAREVRSVIPEEKPKRKSQNVTQKYDRKLMRVRLGLEEWMDEQLRELYECDDDEDYPIEIDIDEILSLNNEERRKEVETLLRDATQPTQFREKHISWRHILNVHEWDVQSGSGLRMLYKISNDHLHLTPSSRMRVSLAAQVLSSTMANALQAQASPETESTQYCIRMMDLFFDCLNVVNLHDGQKKRKISLEPYKSPDDWRFTFLEEDFLGFLDEWESEGMTVPGLSKTERGKLCLSLPTLHGLRMTVKSFVALARELLQEEGVEYLLSEKFSQDPLEEHFSKQRGMGGTHDNPDAKQFGSNMLVLQVAGSCIASSSRANVKSQSIDTSQDYTLPKRQKLKK